MELEKLFRTSLEGRATVPFLTPDATLEEWEVVGFVDVFHQVSF